MEHHRKLERMYAAAPINRFFKPTLRVDEGRAELSFWVADHLHHSAGAMHGCAYFKALDAAAWFAVSSLVTELFVLTTRFEVRLTRPVAYGTVRAVGEVTARGEPFSARAELFDAQGHSVGTGEGDFVRGPVALGPEVHYL